MRDDARGTAAWRASPGALAVRVRAVPEDGAANEAARRTLASMLGRPVSAVRLEAGATAQVKTLVLAGNGQKLAAALERLAGGAAA